MLTSDKPGCWLARHELTDLFITDELCSCLVAPVVEQLDMEDLGKRRNGKFLV